MDEVRILNLIQSADDELCVLGLTTLIHLGENRLIEFFETYGTSEGIEGGFTSEAKESLKCWRRICRDEPKSWGYFYIKYIGSTGNTYIFCSEYICILDYKWEEKINKDMGVRTIDLTKEVVYE